MIRRKYILTVIRVSEEPIITVPKEVVSVPKPSRKKLYAGIIVALMIGLAMGYTISIIPMVNNRNQIRDLQDQLQNQQQQYNMLSTSFQNLQQNYDNLQDSYDTLYTIYESLLDVLKETRTTIVGGNITWRFTTLDGTLIEWYMPIETYVYYVNKPKPEEYHYLTIII